MKERCTIESVRASREGHEFHEAWTARKAFQLLRPDSDLSAIAVEGLSPSDQTRASAFTVEIADITMYFGGIPNFREASRTTIAQFKYSIANQDTNFRASNAKKTIEKFGKTYRDYKKKYGAQAVEDKLDFQLITNQPISKPLQDAIDALASSAPCIGDVEKQAKQLRNASGLTGLPLRAFARKFKILGRTGNLSVTKNELTSLLVDWSATRDPIAAARLGKLRELVREKAGYTGADQNLITRTDILAALQIGDPRDLLPCESRLPSVGKILEREQLADALTRVSRMNAPLLIQATGGIGKTVFMKMLATKISSNHEVVFFDCFGGGAYRSPEDARHLPRNGLIHIANTLAFRGLCDPMLPDNPDVQGLLRTFRRRLVQCLETINRVARGRQLALVIDAIDNADIAARQRSEDCFPVKLLECLDTEPINGLKLIVSCRPERIPKTYAKYEEFELRPFTMDETASFLRARLKKPLETEINVAQARSGGNPRVLDYILKAGRGLLETSEIGKQIELNELIQKRISNALATGIERGYEQKHLDAFLAGLAVLPPPVPIDEYAYAHGITPDAIESFASDLSPLLNRTNHGLMFRDEPTETLVRERYASSTNALHCVASNLMARQDVSVYAARALPGLLHQLDDSERLFALAFDERIPSAITSTIGKRNVRYARLKAATLHAALKKDHNRLARLLIELSTVAAVDQRARDYILDHPDLIVAARDVDATRRLFETRTRWPGTRHARLAIANILLGESEESYRHAYASDEWIEHHRRQRRQVTSPEIGPAHSDIAAIPFFLIATGRGKAAAYYLSRWRDWYAYEVCQLILGYANLAQSITSVPPRRLSRFVGSLSSIGTLSAALSFKELPRAKSKELTVSLARCCKRATKPRLPTAYHRDQFYELQDGLRKSAAIALSLGLPAEAMTISLRAPHRRPGLWSFHAPFHEHSVYPFLFRVALRAAIKKKPVHEKDLLPQELAHICSRISMHVVGKAFRKKVRDIIAIHRSKTPKDNEQDDSSKSLNYEDQQSADRFLTHHLEPLLALTRALSAVLGANSRGLDKAFRDLIGAWETSLKNSGPYRYMGIDRFFYRLGFDMAYFAFWSRSGLKPASVKCFLTAVHKHGIKTNKLVHIVAILAQRKDLRTFAGEQAIKARTLIENEDDVNFRASLFGALGRAMLPASIDEASAYFRVGLEQMDAIGSGDYQFTNELLLFASEMRGDELDEQDFHTLTNICELNMGEEPEKFFWGAYGRGISKASGLKGLAKLSRWDDRSKIALKNTLLPYLTGLLEHGKIDAKDALALNRLANPVEYYFADTKEFAKALRQRAGPDPAVITELIAQFQDDNPGMAMAETVEMLAALAKEALGPNSDLSRHLDGAHVRYAEIRDTRNERSNYRDDTDPSIRKDAKERNRKDRETIKRIAADTNPVDQTSLINAIDQFNALDNRYDLKGHFFADLRKNVPYGDRAKYVRNIAALENFFFFWKFEELKNAREAWAGSSVALTETYTEVAYRLINSHTEDLVSDGSVSGYNIKEISDASGVPMPDLTIELIKVFARPDTTVPGSVWLGLATLICPKADAGIGQLALKRLLSSETARIANCVADGAWATGLYPQEEFVEIAAGMVWRVLGSPYAIDRWRAAHCLRSFARFGRWDVIDSVVARIRRFDAGPFQAKELPFFCMHSRLWLLIALARIGRDYPSQIARYKGELLSYVLEDEDPHVLMRHFASRALLACMGAKKLKLAARIAARVRAADRSPHQCLKKQPVSMGFYSGRPKSAPEPAFQFHLNYEFQKLDVDDLSRVFGQPCWKVADMMSGIVHRIDPTVEAMYDSAGRESRFRHTSYEITTQYHTYGQQLGWHALFLAAGKLLKNHPPVADNLWFEDDPWGPWFSGYALSCDEGLWISDGTDRTPLDTAEFLLERTDRELVITGNREKILALAALGSQVGKELVVQGRWFSADNVQVHISSALVPSRKAAAFARKLVGEDPMFVWVPSFDEGAEDSEFVRYDKEFTPWIVCSSGETRLDKHDPYGVAVANCRSRLANDFAAVCSLSKNDPFGRVWKDKRGRPLLSAEAWGREGEQREDGPHAGTRLFCASSALKKILTKYKKDLLILIKLQRYEKESYRRNSRFTHTVAVARITRALDLDYFKGRINHAHESRW